MGAELLAELRGLIGGMETCAGNPWTHPLVLFAVILAFYLIYRWSSS